MLNSQPRQSEVGCNLSPQCFIAASSILNEGAVILVKVPNLTRILLGGIPSQTESIQIFVQGQTNSCSMKAWRISTAGEALLSKFCNAFNIVSPTEQHRLQPKLLDLSFQCQPGHDSSAQYYTSSPIDSHPPSRSSFPLTAVRTTILYSHMFSIDLSYS